MNEKKKSLNNVNKINAHNEYQQKLLFLSPDDSRFFI